jgi:AAA ATPase containing von Willebrand factor type A (vWA) domain
MTKLQKISNLQSPTPRPAPLVLGFWILSGAWTLGSWSFAAAPAAPSAPPPPEPPALSRIVTRLSTAASRSGRDWAEFARETITWGSRLKSSGEQVPAGPVRDGLAAVDLGSELDPKTADWPQLRQELEALLDHPEEPPPQDQQNQDQQQQDQQNQDQQKQDQQQKQNSSDQKQQQDQQQQDQQSDENQDSQNPENQQQNQQQKQQPQDREDQSAFGDMEEKNTPPPPEETQQVGGVPERKEGSPPPVDPNLALPLQKLEQLKNQDSPAELFQLMENRPDDSSRKTKKDW